MRRRRAIAPVEQEVLHVVVRCAAEINQGKVGAWQPLAAVDEVDQDGPLPAPRLRARLIQTEVMVKAVFQPLGRAFRMLEPELTADGVEHIIVNDRLDALVGRGHLCPTPPSPGGPFAMSLNVLLPRDTT